MGVIAISSLIALVLRHYKDGGSKPADVDASTKNVLPADEPVEGDASPAAAVGETSENT